MSFGDWEEWRERRNENGGATVGWAGTGEEGLMPNDHPWRAAHLAQMWDPPPKGDIILSIDVVRRLAERRAG